MPRGGHFTAMKEPELLAEDLRGFFRACGSGLQLGGMAAAGGGGSVAGS
jgi:hypothetical protein